MFIDYLKTIGLEKLIEQIDKVQLNNVVEEAFHQKKTNFSDEEMRKLYMYDIPKITPDGSCSILEEKNDIPYNLAETFGLIDNALSQKEREETIKNSRILKNSLHTLRLWRLQQITEKIYKLTKVDWFGIYRKLENLKGEAVLAKEAYLGVFSRPEFPLTQAFAKKSNNSTVGLTGKAIVIQDVEKHSGAYYTCDTKVQSEFCLPIFSQHNFPLLEERIEVKSKSSSQAGHQSAKPHPYSLSPGELSFTKGHIRGEGENELLVGIIDAEAAPKNFFTDSRLLQIAKVAYDLGKKNLGIA